MRRLLKFGLVLLAVIALGMGALYLFVPANEHPTQGNADPALTVRRPIIEWLRELDVLDEPIIFSRDALLPSGRGATYYEPQEVGSNDAPTVAQRESFHWEPVYRGLFWVVGDRLTYRDEFTNDDRHDIKAIRLWYEEDGSRTIAATGTAENGLVAADGRYASVKGYVPRSAAAYGIEFVLPDGTVKASRSWERR